MITCPNSVCGLPLADDAIYCPKCRKQAQMHCPSCHKLTEIQHPYCRHCQADLQPLLQLRQKGWGLEEQYKQERKKVWQAMRSQRRRTYMLIGLLALGLGALVGWLTFDARYLSFSVAMGSITTMFFSFIPMLIANSWFDKKANLSAFRQAFHRPPKDAFSNGYISWQEVAKRFETEEEEMTLLIPSSPPPDKQLLRPANGSKENDQ